MTTQPAPAPDAKGFLAALFDFKFDTLITPKIVKIVYIIGTVAIGFFGLSILVAGLISGDPLTVIGALIFAPLAALIYLALFRMTLEMYYAVIRISEDVHDRLPPRA